MKKMMMVVMVASVLTVSMVSADTGVRGVAQQDIPATDSWQDFEAMLRSSYVGTYAIYGTLPQRKKQQIYSQVKQGASIDEVRQQIVQARLSTK